MLDRGSGGPVRGGFVRLSLFGAILLVASCTSPPKGEVSLHPIPQRHATHQVVGESILASLGGPAVIVRWLSPQEVEHYFASRPGLVSPWPQEIWKQAPPTVFLLRVRNQTPEEVQFDPTLAALVSQEGWRERPMSYEEMYLRMGGVEASGPGLRSLQATLLSRFVVMSPGGEREGLLVFPTLDPTTKYLLLELASFFVGGRSSPGLFEFQVVRQKTE